MARSTQVRERSATIERDSSPIDWGEVAQAAYELFQRRGGEHGRDQQDWFEAEQLVRQRRARRSAR